MFLTQARPSVHTTPINFTCKYINNSQRSLIYGNTVVISSSF